MVHKLYTSRAKKKAWLFGVLILVMTLFAEYFIHLHAYFTDVDWFAFNAVWGFLSCLLMVVFAKLLGLLIKRREDYYGDNLDDN